MTRQSGRGRLVIVSGPSAVGKTTLLAAVARRSKLPLVFSVSATTRPPRPGEAEGVDYYFLAPAEFERRREGGEFLECFEVFGGAWYGTLRSEVFPRLAAGNWVVLRIDVQGALAVMEQFPDAVSVFIAPRSFDVLEDRMRGRNADDEASMRRRLDEARREIALAGRYRHRVVNDDFNAAVEELCNLLAAEADTPDSAPAPGEQTS